MTNRKSLIYKTVAAFLTAVTLSMPISAVAFADSHRDRHDDGRPRYEQRNDDRNRHNPPPPPPRREKNKDKDKDHNGNAITGFIIGAVVGAVVAKNT